MRSTVLFFVVVLVAGSHQFPTNNVPLKTEQNAGAVHAGTFDIKDTQHPISLDSNVHSGQSSSASIALPSGASSRDRISAVDPPKTIPLIHESQSGSQSAAHHTSVGTAVTADHKFNAPQVDPLAHHNVHYRNVQPETTSPKAVPANFDPKLSYSNNHHPGQFQAPSQHDVKVRNAENSHQSGPIVTAIPPLKINEKTPENNPSRTPLQHSIKARDTQGQSTTQRSVKVEEQKNVKTPQAASVPATIKTNENKYSQPKASPKQIPAVISTQPKAPLQHNIKARDTNGQKPVTAIPPFKTNDPKDGPKVQKTPLEHNIKSRDTSTTQKSIKVQDQKQTPAATSTLPKAPLQHSIKARDTNAQKPVTAIPPVKVNDPKEGPKVQKAPLEHNVKSRDTSTTPKTVRNEQKNSPPKIAALPPSVNNQKAPINPSANNQKAPVPKPAVLAASNHNIKTRDVNYAYVLSSPEGETVYAFEPEFAAGERRIKVLPAFLG